MPILSSLKLGGFWKGGCGGVTILQNTYSITKLWVAEWQVVKAEVRECNLRRNSWGYRLADSGPPISRKEFYDLFRILGSLLRGEVAGVEHVLYAVGSKYATGRLCADGYCHFYSVEEPSGLRM